MFSFLFKDEYTREKSQRTKAKKRAKKRPQSASIADVDSVRMNILLRTFILLIYYYSQMML